jgi:arylsulfatase A-like enzyme
MLGFGAVGATMLASCTPLSGVAGPGSADQSAPPPAQAKYLAVVIVDGCRADYLSATPLPTIESMASNGVLYLNAWTGMMESITPACHASIGTGLFPKNNGGILGFYWENPQTQVYNESVNLYDTLTSSAPGGQAAIDPTSLSDILRQAKAPTMTGLLKQVDPTAKVYAGAGVKFYAADVAAGPDADFTTYFWNDGATLYRPLEMRGKLPAEILQNPALRTHNYTRERDHTVMNYIEPGKQDSLVVDLAVEVLKRERPRIVILNLGEMDFPFGHMTGGPLTPKDVRKIMGNADRAIKRLQDAYRELGIFEQTVFAFLGDHGMVPLAQRVEPYSAVRTAAARAGTSQAATPPAPPQTKLHAIDAHTGAYVWLADPDRAFKVSQLLDEMAVPGVSVIYFRAPVDGRPQYLPSPASASRLNASIDGAYRYLLETMNGPNAPHVALIYQELTGTLGVGGFPNKPWHGDHGGASWGSHHIPLILSGPGTVSGVESRFPARLVDLAPTFLRLLGVPFPLLDGVVLADAFMRPTNAEIAAQRTMGSMLIPITAALRRQSVIDIQSIQQHGAVNPPPAATSHGFAGIGVY